MKPEAAGSQDVLPTRLFVYRERATARRACVPAVRISRAQRATPPPDVPYRLLIEGGRKGNAHDH